MKKAIILSGDSLGYVREIARQTNMKQSEVVELAIRRLFSDIDMLGAMAIKQDILQHKEKEKEMQ